MDSSSVIISGAVIAGTTIVLGLVALKRRVAGKPKSVPDGVVLLHQFRRTRQVPNASPPCLKLETYLRMAKIPYESDFTMPMSKKGKSPWIEFNGQAIADSNFCVRFLNQELGVDVDHHLDEKQRAVAHAFLTLVEENTYWTLVHYRWIHNPVMIKKLLSEAIPWPFYLIVLWFAQRKTKGYLHGHGLGRHSVDEINSIAARDLQAVSNYLGDNKFLMGDKPSLVDCAVFGVLASFVYQDTDSPQRKYIKENLPNLLRYVETMKQEFYPDWNEL